ncbi:MAG TPA: hypothetical protein VGP93_12285, partial [Polyangiaceae bacterium]|nr:hypothetical protein [Polyangiaceae bacterium]
MQGATHGIDSLAPRAAPELGMAALDRTRPWLYGVAMASVLTIGVVFRTIRYWYRPISLWLDEAWWARHLVEKPLTEQVFRPIGYMALSRMLAGISRTEQSLRLLSWLCGIGSLFVALYLGSRLFRARLTRLLFVFAVAFQPLLIDMAREFKPYSLEFCLHLSLLAMYLRWRETLRQRWFWALLASLSLSFVLAYNVVFALPGPFVLLALELWQRQKFRPLAALVASAVLALALMLGLYVTVIRKQVDMGEAAESWAKKYNVFYVSSEFRAKGATVGDSRLTWLRRRYFETAAFPGIERRYWKAPPDWPEARRELLSRVDSAGWFLLHVMGLFVLLYQRRFRVLTLFAAPLVVAMAFNLVGYWPLGEFRGNTFLLAYLIAIPMFALDGLLASLLPLRIAGTLLGSALILLPNMTIGRNDHRRKYALVGNFEINPLLRRLNSMYDRIPQSQRHEKVTVLLDNYTCWVVMFYPGHMDGFKERFEESSK